MHWQEERKESFERGKRARPSPMPGRLEMLSAAASRAATRTSSKGGHTREPGDQEAAAGDRTMPAGRDGDWPHRSRTAPSQQQGPKPAVPGRPSSGAQEEPVKTRLELPGSQRREGSRTTPLPCLQAEPHPHTPACKLRGLVCAQPPGQHRKPRAQSHGESPSVTVTLRCHRPGNEG